MRKNSRAFTLVELLVVIAIIGILALGGLAVFNSARIKSREARRIVDLREIANALHLYNTDNASFPNNLSDLVPSGYIPAIPPDPLPTNGSYAYRSSTCTPSNQRFVLRAILETDHDALDSDIDAVQCGDLDCNDYSHPNYYCIDQ